MTTKYLGLTDLIIADLAYDKTSNAVATRAVPSHQEIALRVLRVEIVKRDTAISAYIFGS
jgi:hypothetical protein